MKKVHFHRCSYIHCKTGLPGIVIPIGTFLPKPLDGMPPPSFIGRAHAIMSDLRLCESCALTAKIHELIDDKRWQNICDQIKAQGGPPPDRETLELEFGSPKDQPLPKIFVDAFKRMKAHRERHMS